MGSETEDLMYDPISMRRKSTKMNLLETSVTEEREYQQPSTEEVEPIQSSREDIEGTSETGDEAEELHVEDRLEKNLEGAVAPALIVEGM